MEIVIDISEEVYQQVLSYNISGNILNFRKAVKNGTPLPKNHGRLIDEAEVIKSLFDFVKGTKTIGQCIDDTPTIIEGSEAE